MSSVSRRTLAKGATWTVPAVALAAAAPAAALSCPTTVAADIEAAFTARKRRMPNLRGVNLRISFHSAAHAQGALNTPSVHVVNNSSFNVDASQLPLRMDIAVKHVDTSPAVNTTFTKDAVVAGPLNSRPMIRPWAADGSNRPEAGDAPGFVGQCGPDTKAIRRRDFSIGSSYYDVLNPITGEVVRKAVFAELGEEYATCMPDTGGAYGYSLVVGKSIPANKRVNVMQFHMRDGATVGNTRIYVGIGMRIRGFYAPSWSDVVTAVKAKYPKFSDEDVSGCYRSAYDARAQQWYSSGESLAGAVISVSGWSRFYDSKADVMGWTRQLPADTWVWSHEVGNFMLAGDEGQNNRISGVRTWSPSRVQSSSLSQSVIEMRHRDGIY